MTQTPMLRSHAMVNETYVRKGQRATKRKRGITESARDDGSHEEHQDTCCRNGCGRLGIWYSVTGKAYCDDHWKRYKQQDDVRRRYRSEGRCWCGKTSVSPGKRNCQSCIDRADSTRRQHVANGLCSCGRERELGRMKCAPCLRSNLKAAQRIYARKKEAA